MMSKTILAPGSTARIYRDGEILVGQLLVPVEGRFEVRHLDPGQYVARDECGGERAFEVKLGSEVTVVQGTGAPVGPTGEAGSSHTDPVEYLTVGPQEIANEHEPEHAMAPRGRSRLTAREASSDERRTEGAAGSSVTEGVEFGPQPVNERAWRKAAPSADDLAALDAE